jgi:hypothetical protein
MNNIFTYLQLFYKSVDKTYLIICSVLAALFIFFNYKFSIETKLLAQLTGRWQKFAGFYIVYLIAFSVPYLLLFLLKRHELPMNYKLLVLIIIAPAIFAFKVTAGGWRDWILQLQPGVWGRYIASITDLPIRFILVLLLLLLVKIIIQPQQGLWGLTAKNFNASPYFIMLVIMVPLIAFASTQHDFLSAYPKYKQVGFIYPHVKNKDWVNGLYELSYGIDFITIETFFRGFLIIAFVKYVGPYAIVPAAVFYCSIHFGKPLLECISSYFGGMLLGIVAWQTQSILGGLIVHLGIAWMMETGSFIGNKFLNIPQTR